MKRALVILILTVTGLVIGPRLVLGGGVSGIAPLTPPGDSQWHSLLPADTHLLIETGAIEQFLDALDVTPPDWAAIYGRGHDDPGLDERLFNLNRGRDTKREGKMALAWRVTFLWPGELSDYDPRSGGFRVAVGPRFTPTRWGVVRFKPEELPSNLMAIPNPGQRETLQRRIGQGQPVEVDVALTGKLISPESLIYDFSHDEEGRGVIMPVVRIERIDFVILSCKLDRCR